MKKIISLILGLALIITYVPSLASDIEAVVSESMTDVADSRELLLAIGVEPSFSDDLSAAVTRADFLSSVVAAMKLSLTDNTRENCFYDVRSSDSFCSAVNYSLELGYISEGQYFRPNDPITYAEAVKIITTALGYDIDAQYKGGYPTGYAMISKTLGLDDGIRVDLNSTLTVAQSYIILANMLESDIRVTSSIIESEGELSFKYRQVSNILTVLYDWYPISGIVSGNAVTHLYDNTEELSDGFVIIGSRRYRITLNPLLGTYVEGYAVKEGSGETVKYLKSDADSVLTLFSKNEPHLAGGKIEYVNEEGKEFKASLEKMLAVVYNGKSYVNYSAKDFDIEVGKIILVDSNSNGSYDVAHIYNGEIIVADIVNTDTEKLIDSYRGITVYYGDEDSFKIFEDGVPGDISYIAPNAVMEYYPAKDGNYKELNLITGSVSGKITGKGDGVIYVNDVPYGITQYFKDRYMPNLTLGTVITFVVTSDNRLATVDTEPQSAMKLAYVYKAKLTTGLDSSVILKALSRDGNHVELTLAEKVNLSNSGIVTAKVIYDRYFDGNKESVMRYSTNGDGVVTAVYFPETPAASQPESVFNSDSENKDIIKPYVVEGVSDTTMVYYKIFGLFVPYFTIDGNTKVFCIDPDTNKSDEERYTIGSVSSWANDSEMALGSIKAYNVTSSGRADIIVVSRALNTTLSEDGAAGGIIESITTAYDAHGEKALKISMCSGNSYSTAYIEESHEKYAEATDVVAKTDLSIGDYIIYNKDEYNNIISYTKHFDYSEGSLNHASATGRDNDILVYFYGELGSIEASSFSLDLINASGATKTGKISLLMQHTTATVVDIPSGKVRGISFGQASDYMNQGYKVLVRTRYADIYEFIIYKE